jgi:hypothetical protein
MKLTFKERLALTSVLPEQGTFGTLRTVRRLREALEFTDAEREQYTINGVPMPDGNVIWSWAPEHAKARLEVAIDLPGQAFLVNTLKELNVAGRLPDVLLDVACELIPEAKG